MEMQGQIMATMGSARATAVVAWDGLTRDELLDAMDAILNFLEGNHKAPFTEPGLRSGRAVRVRPLSMPDFGDLDMEV